LAASQQHESWFLALPNHLVRRKLDVTFIKGSQAGTFHESGKDKVKLSGLRISAEVTKAGGASQGSLDMRVWGMTESKMRDLSTLGFGYGSGTTQYNDNGVLLEAGDDDNGMGSVFYGTIHDAWADYQGMPDCPFHVAAHIGGRNNLNPASPTSYRGLVDVATILAGMCDIAGYTFHNDGVTTKFENVYYPGTIGDQIRRVCDHAHINFQIDNGPPPTLTIWPKGQARGGAVPLISENTGMIGSPVFTRSGLVVTTLFNPSIVIGGNVKVESKLQPCNGTWNVLHLSHTLDAEITHGNWLTRFEGLNLNFHPPPGERNLPG
jgi:hypothetical protein